MRLLLPGILLLAACRFDASTASVANDAAEINRVDADPFAPDADPTLPDANPLDPDAAPCPAWEFAPSLFTPCGNIQEATAPLVLDAGGEYTYDTTDGILRPPGGGTPIGHSNSTLGSSTRAPRVINTSSFQIAAGNSLRATGDRPLLIVSWSGMTIAGDIDVSSVSTNDVGAGGSADQCSAAGNGGEPGSPATGDDQGGGGGGGGGFGAAGGVGGAGQNTGNNPGGTAGAAKSLAFHGGCAGGRGGLGDGDPGDNERGVPGQGGGAVFLSARTALQVEGTINAGGMGGGGGQNNRAAGGGGGSGGLVVLEAASINLPAGSRLAANGGGGGGGGNNTPSAPGQVGQAAEAAALGGVGENNNGGVGGFLDTPEGLIGATGSRGGGGGGGGVGYILLRGNNISSALADVISPAPQSTTIAFPTPVP